MIECEIRILGCGGSGGVPLATGYWGNCDPHNPKNRRTRAAILIRTERTVIIVDTGPDFHAQMLKNNVSKIDAIIYTHEHADHTNGIDDVRYAAIHRRIHGEKDFLMPIYADEHTISDFKQRFNYIFNGDKNGLYAPLLVPNIIKNNQNLEIGDISIRFFPQIHGYGSSLGLLIGDIAYSTDVSEMPEESLNKMKGIKTWIVDCGQFDTDKTTVHANMDKVLRWNETVGAKHLILTHLKPSEDYDVMNAATPNYIEPAYDGLSLKTIL